MLLRDTLLAVSHWYWLGMYIIHDVISDTLYVDILMLLLSLLHYTIKYLHFVYKSKNDTRESQCAFDSIPY